MASDVRLIEGPVMDPVDKNTPMRLEQAAKIAFPTGGMTVAGLRREIGRGTLPFEKIAGKYFVTLAYIEEMRRRCRGKVKEPGSTFVQPDLTPPETSPMTLPGSSETDAATTPLDALNAKLQKLSERSKTT